ncbi:serine/threonine-protein kinase [Streptomyces sp. H10-C2]|uniref:serine/threonine-protein kinase n=1 Tax=unclassified Streptomyces TaxID=2593676 RepID=UPI0024BA9B0C|nr:MULTISPECIES: serine/threonine-protein kinase [unclassified Streptomyces]MDJ0346063.1 serine/threonine-protein kinase [Streptomyces sp. PH10-H1]MDJ0373039.1 serine/threonine-protein kinase [Streptomyces sp. H10-C2]
MTLTGGAVHTFDQAMDALRHGFPEDRAAATRLHRRLARLLHPDTAPPGRRAEAAAAFLALNERWRQHLAAHSTAHLTITTRRHTYVLGGTQATGDLAVLRRAAYEHDGVRHDALLKIPLRPYDNDLIEHEADVLARLDTAAEPRHRAYAPRLIETFRHRDTSGTERRVNALEPLDGFHSLSEVAAAHPGGLDPRDAAWMWRRLLVALGWAHRARLVHSAVFPEHVLIHPALHGLVLIDWCYATATGTTAPVLIERHRDRYPPEIPGRQPVTEATDLHLAVRCMEHLMGERVPKPLAAFIRGCTLPGEAGRPHDAWRLLTELDELLERLYGPRTFRPFTMPIT